MIPILFFFLSDVFNVLFGVVVLSLLFVCPSVFLSAIVVGGLGDRHYCAFRLFVFAVAHLLPIKRGSLL